MSNTTSTQFTLDSSFFPPCTVNLPHGLTRDELLSFPAFKNWISTLQYNLSLQSHPSHTFHASPYQLRHIDVQSVDWFGKRLGFVKIQAEVKNEKGEWLPGAVFLRGGSVGMLLILQPDDVQPGTEIDKHVLLTVQPRIASGSLALTELPAGMLDDGTFSGTAAKEISEETGLEVPESKLINLTELALAGTTTTPSTQGSKPGNSANLKEKLQNAMYPSPGACDEFIPLFLYQKRVPRSQLDEWRGKLTGLRDEGEKITIKLVRLEDLWKEGGRDAKALAALSMYEGLRREGKI
ncbi:NUDIX family hydrolase [Lepidopterella palustris CBS 459.81]|uniref:NUDIX family hydrolase n=1 Tax=Lepidopterella palustris CBS 459.81 TaxID=1314670 RepID=A0A8E2JHE7_9PEZI|nr:NUDIX family hydrolase [Lepidopterella palustris CBS 459.81]